MCPAAKRWREIKLALAERFDQYRGRLRRMVMIRMHPHLQQRVDASDVLQEAFIDLSRRLPQYAKQQKLPLFLWLRLMTGQRLALVRREHLGVAKRIQYGELIDLL